MKRTPHTWQIQGPWNHSPPETLSGYRIGALGITKAFRKGWRVFHLPTGLTVANLNRDTLKGCEAAVHQALGLPIPWEAAEQAEIVGYLRSNPDVLNALQTLSKDSQS